MTEHIICRPDKLTSRWIQEITEGIYNRCIKIRNPKFDHMLETTNICPNKISSSELDSLDNKNLEIIWNNYINVLYKSECIYDPIINNILEGTIDYNEYRK